MLTIGCDAYVTADKMTYGAYRVKIVSPIFDPDSLKLTHYVFKVYTHVDDYISIRSVEEVFPSKEAAEQFVAANVARDKKFKKMLKESMDKLKNYKRPI